MNTHRMIRSDPARLLSWFVRSFLLAAASFSFRVLAAPPKPAQPAPPPATAPAAQPPSPKGVALAFVTALEKGDAPAAKALLPNDETHAKWVDASIALSASLKKLDAAATARFKEAGNTVSQNQLHLADSPKAIEQAAEKIEGDAATLTLPNQPQPIRLMRVAGKWQLQLGPTGPDAAKQLALYNRLTQATNKMTDELTAGRYPTAEAATRAFAAKLLEARLEK